MDRPHAGARPVRKRGIPPRAARLAADHPSLGALGKQRQLLPCVVISALCALRSGVILASVFSAGNRSASEISASRFQRSGLQRAENSARASLPVIQSVVSGANKKTGLALCPVLLFLSLIWRLAIVAFTFSTTPQPAVSTAMSAIICDRVNSAWSAIHAHAFAQPMLRPQRERAILTRESPFLLRLRGRRCPLSSPLLCDGKRLAGRVKDSLR